jgi:hypothetical protein
MCSCSKQQEKLNVYYCDMTDNAFACQEGCTIDREMKYSFHVNKEDKSVLQIVYSDGVQIGSITHKNCTIFSNENWDCSEFNTFTNVTQDYHTKMANGIYSAYREIRNRSDYKLRNTDKGTCAK